MGMFDELYFEESPFPEHKDMLYFQTKSLDNVMEQYRVTKDGKLQVSEFKMRAPRPEEQHEINGLKLPIAIKEHVRWADTDITGTIEAYDMRDGVWYSLEMVVIYGKVDKIIKNKIELENDNK